MRCPFCATQDTRVLDSRLINEGDQVRRRRECNVCKERFTTFEMVELTLPRIVKRDGNREPFEESKLRSGMLKALEKDQSIVMLLKHQLLNKRRLWQRVIGKFPCRNWENKL